MKRLNRSISVVVAVAGLVGAAHAGGGNMASTDGLWTAQIDPFGQVDALTPMGQFDRVSESWVFDANTDSAMICRRMQNNYAVVMGPTIDMGGTHSYTKLAKSTGNGPAPSGDCCEPHPSEGCEDPVCEAAVCAFDDFCCLEDWDEVCVGHAEVLRGCDCSPAVPALAIEIENTMIDGPNGGVLSVIRSINESLTETYEVKLFYYVDLDIGSPEDDEATPIFDGGLVAIEQAIFPDILPLWFGGCPPYKSWEIDVWPLLIQKLDSNTVTQLSSTDHTIPGADDHSLALSTEAVMLGPGQTLFFTSAGVRESGCVGVVLEGDIELRPVVSQGCRPVGKPWVITECEQNRIRKLAGRPALEILMETWHGLPSQDQRLLQSAPFLGLAIDAMKRSFERGDFLVRSIMGLDQRDRSITVADFVRRGQTVQLLVRDAQSAGEDLRLLMAGQGGGALGEEAHRAGALIFSCNGRGSRMFDVPDHDIGCVREGLNAEVPVAGFFAAGEIGPVGGRNFLHGFTASVAVFRSRTPRTA